LNAEMTAQTPMMAVEEVRVAVESRIRLNPGIPKALPQGTSLDQPDIDSAIATVVSTDIADTGTVQRGRKEASILALERPAFGLHDC
jgi:hypothetical protein